MDQVASRSHPNGKSGRNSASIPVQSFGTAIRSPFVPFDPVYLGGKCTESFFDFLDLLGGYFWLETEHDNVAKHFLLLGSIAATEHQAENVRIVSEAKIVFFMMIRINL